jgi:hypothetical protein
MKEGNILKESTFQYYKEDGSVAEEKNEYFYIVDGGYNIWIELIAPFKKHEPELPIGHVWSKPIEPVRKDVECVFGILKKRFMILKHPYVYDGWKPLSTFSWHVLSYTIC